jgi:transcriptional regulator with XRE-family HTH domain
MSTIKGSAEQPCRTEQPFRVYTAASIGPAIRQYRKQSGLTQAQLAERSGISRTYLSRLEGGHETEQLRRILGVLRELGVRATLQHADW